MKVLFYDSKEGFKKSGSYDQEVDFKDFPNVKFDLSDCDELTVLGKTDSLQFEKAVSNSIKTKTFIPHTYDKHRTLILYTTKESFDKSKSILKDVYDKVTFI